MNNQTAAELQAQFRRLYGGTPRIFRAPGRVNLIGEHTDYNDGFVLPAAIDFYVWVAIAPRSDRKLRLHSINFCESTEVDLRNEPRRRIHWSDYIQGVAVALQNRGRILHGSDLLISGDVPIGSGLSSSAAIEVAAALALSQDSGFTLDRIELAKLCCQVENEFVGARVGIMDQFISCYGKAGYAVVLDCRVLEYRLLPLPKDVSLVICDTMVKHEVARSGYNTRRAECEEGVRMLVRSLPQMRALRDVSLGDLQIHAQDLPEKIYRRCRHVVSENERVTGAASALLDADLLAFGGLMGDSHDSLRDDYEVSCAELDLMVELAVKQEGVYGARMTGGGFGGCTINLVETDAVSGFRQAVARGYEQATGLAPQIFVSAAADGATEVQT